MNAIGQRTGVAISDRAHQYDAIGNRQKTANSLTLPVADNYTANALNQYTSFSSVASYDLSGNITRKALPNGTATQSTFDALSRKLTETTRTAGGGLISSFDYSQATAGYPSSYDKVGSLLKIAEFYGRADVKARTVTNTHDHTYRLATETAAEVGGTTVTSTYGYDKNNNRTSKIVTGGSNPGTWTSVYGTTADGYNSNQLKTVTNGGVLTTFQYDPNGNRSTKQVGGAMVQGYVFDFENRLITLADLTKGSFGYTYDHRTRRVGRDELGGTGVPAASVKISFSGGLSVQEYTAGTGTPNVETIRGSDYGGGIGGVLYTIRSGARSYNAYNSRGDVVSKTDGGGSITWQSSYEAFGTRTQEQGTTADRQKANTKDEDPTGLLNEGMRYRDLETGVFLTRDPMGFVDGPNVYTYVRQNPWTKFDPLGLWETGSYWGDVGQVYVGYGRAIKGTVVGIGTMVAHPIQTAKGIGSAVASPIQTGKAIVADYEGKLQTNAGVGEIIGEVLIGVATGGSVKALDKASDVADIAKITNKIDDVADVGGGSARLTKEVSEKASDQASDLSPTNYPNPDPPMDSPAVRYDPKTNDELMRMRQGKGPTTKKTHGDQNIEAHHRQQVPTSQGGKIDEVTKQQHRGAGNHSRHNQPSQLTPAQRAKETREHYKKRGDEYVTDGEGI